MITFSAFPMMSGIEIEALLYIYIILYGRAGCDVNEC